MTRANHLQFQTYLQSISDKYKYWWNIYTLTDAEGKKREEKQFSSPFDFGLIVETLQPKQTEKKQSQEKIERLPVLEGIRKYASKHVLLVGKPGSGKSTALARLLLEEAQAHLEINSQVTEVNDTTIPILVELRYWQTSVFERIQAFLQQHDGNLNIDETTLKTLLRQGKFLLLIDGVNELPSEDARRQIATFRKDYPQTPMIFTTRDLGVGGDLGIEKKLEMQPLNETQMREFVMAYLPPQQGEEMLQRLGDRLREFGKTPLLLWMLCGLFQQTENIPPNLGMVFRSFTQSYENSDRLKRDVPVTAESRRWWKSLLEHLAFMMMQGESVTEFRVAISKREVEEIFTKYLIAEQFDKPRDYAKCWLEDLLNHHLVQVGSGDKIEFRHQLLQEYYAAEYLLRQLPHISDAKLQRDYLNLLKWTEPVALMLALVEYETPLRVVQLALDVDLMLGARLAGEVKSEFQEKTVGLVLGLNVTHEVKFYLLGLTRSQQALSLLLEAWNSKDSKKNYGYAIAEALTYVGCDEAMSTIIKWEDEQIESWNKAAQYEDWDNYLLREKIISELASIASSNIAIYKLVTSLNDKNFITLEGSDFYRKGRNYKAKEVLGDKVFEQAISFLLQVLNNEDLYIRYCAASALGKIGSEAEVIDLTKAVKDENYFVRYSVTKALGKIGSSKAISALLKAVSDEKSFVRYQAVEALGKIDDERGINALIKALKDEEPDIRRIAAQTLGNKGIYLAINALVRTLKDEKSSVSSTARYALLNIRKSLVEDRLWNIFSYSDIENVIFESDDFSKTSAVYKKLYNIYNKCLQDVLDDHSFLKKYKELSVYLNSNTSLIEAELKYQIWEVILNANFEPKSMIIKIQEQCLFYNYNIFHSPPVEDDKNSDTPVKTILILAANPKNTSQLRLDEEVREIDEGLRRANKRDLFWLEQKWAVRERDFYRAILDTQPQIIHFCGHGEEEDGIVLEDETGQKALVNADTLASIFNLFATKGFATKGVECVVLNACYSQVQAEAISQHINYVIGMSSSIGDKAAIKFAVAFYDALGAGEGVESAFKLGCSQLVALKEHQTPVLKKRLIERAPPQES